MDPPAPLDFASSDSNLELTRTTSDAQASQDSQTAADYISSQLQLEADAREALPYQFDTCTYPLGPLRQSVFSCLTCKPPPSDPSAPYAPAGVCYSCSISCHGEHELVELFTRRNFVCDCGTKRLPATSTCSLRINEETNTKGGVHSEEPSATNRYNQNFRNRFCGCGDLYDAHKEEGTMYQCYGLGNVEDGGCGEDWWHPECLMGLKRDWYKQLNGSKDTHSNGVAERTPETMPPAAAPEPNEATQLQTEAGRETTEAGAIESKEGHPDPPGFPEEDDFEHLICYKCVEAFPWIKAYAGSPGFLPGVSYLPNQIPTNRAKMEVSENKSIISTTDGNAGELSRKRKADDSPETPVEQPMKRTKSDEQQSPAAPSNPQCKYSQLPPPSPERISLFLKDDFRDHLCRCRDCFGNLAPHAHLLEEETIYEPPMSSAASDADGEAGRDGSASIGSRSLLDRGEAALSNMDRVRAIEGVMVYNHLRDKVKDFLKPFAESGTAVGAEDVKKYFEKLRGDEQAIKAAQMGQAGGDGGGRDTDNRREQGGY